MLTPEAVHRGRAGEILGQRRRTLEAAYHARPERFPNGAPRVPALPEAVYINPPAGPQPASQEAAH